MTQFVTVTVPATSANLGPGFDCIGVALALYNRFTFSCTSGLADPVKIQVQGLERDRVAIDPTNLVYQAFTHLYDYLGLVPPPVVIDIELGVPLARGLGSSATAIVAGLVGANELAGKPLKVSEVMGLAIEMEGHPDNVVPALLGGCYLAASQEVASSTDIPWVICDLPWHPSIVPVVAIPDFELSTTAARQVLPQNYSRADVIFNASHLSLLVRALETGERLWLKAALDDRVHQPYRFSLIAGYERVRAAAMMAGADGLVISGAGPTLLAFADPTVAPEVAGAMEIAWKEQGIQAEVKILEIDTHGARGELSKPEVSITTD